MYNLFQQEIDNLSYKKNPDCFQDLTVAERDNLVALYVSEEMERDKLAFIVKESLEDPSYFSDHINSIERTVEYLFDIHVRDTRESFENNHYDEGDEYNFFYKEI